ncbi:MULTISPECIES: hypothetical protein [unclassified Leisingera]|uniref:hypothetical protein n=1 Tax=unclassified Leisingera TaxID=2614906 RepID=UPI0003005053|nr:MULTISPECIES: hypothetical protein [unclassified Leisingera]KIC23306.1 hypothetical protein RA23_14580 [Leisingera sp. ANG-S3]KIC49343.1 hypothetical protein RA22_21200 [Leisingera sp. ANG-S]KID08506.1 hypothetical protein GC1_15290 [Leisingera sp. ANG1]
MLKLKADAQPAAEPGEARGKAVRIDGVSAPKNIKIGLVAAHPEPAKAKPASSAAASAVQAAKSGQPAKSSVPAKPEPKAAPEPKQFAPVAAEGPSALPKLGLAAAGLAVAAAMLLYFQFGGSDAAEAVQAVAVPVEQNVEAVPAGAAAAAGLEGTAASGEDALVARITEGTLAALRSKQAQPAASVQAAPAEGSALYKMVLTAAAQGQSAAYIDQLVNGAYERQEISVPASLIGADGRVDTATLLALFVGN